MVLFSGSQKVSIYNRFLVYYAELKLVCVSVFVGVWVGDCALVGLKVSALLKFSEWKLSLARPHNKELT